MYVEIDRNEGQRREGNLLGQRSGPHVRGICICQKHGRQAPLYIGIIHQYDLILSHSLLYYAVLCYTILYYTMLYQDMLCYLMICYTILYYTILCYPMLCYTKLYYTILCCTILCHTITCYNIRCHPILYHSYQSRITETVVKFLR